MVIFHGYVSLPEGNHHDMKKNRPPWLKQAKCRSFSWGNHGFSWFFPHLQAIDYFRGDAEYHMYSQLVGFIKSRISYHDIVYIYIYISCLCQTYSIHIRIYIYIYTMYRLYYMHNSEGTLSNNAFIPCKYMYICHVYATG